MAQPLTKVYYKVDIIKPTNITAEELAITEFEKWLQSFDESESLESIRIRIIKGFEDVNASNNSYSACVCFYLHEDANAFRRYFNYTEIDGIARIVTFWYGIRAGHEVVAKNMPRNTSRRTVFEKFEKYGDIGRVTPCKSNPSVFWIAFISSKGAKNAIANETYISERKLTVQKAVSSSR